MKLNGWFLTLVSASFFAFFGWVGTTTVNHGERLARIETSLSHQEAWFEVVNNKLDQAIGGRRRPRLPAREETQPDGVSQSPLADLGGW